MAGDLQTALSDLLDAHDIRYLSPASEGRFALPVGNGDLGTMVWTPPGRLQLAINKSNAWDDAPDYPVPDWHWSPLTEEKMTALVSCAALSIRNNLPLFEPLYLDDFEARVHLREGYVSVNARSPFCTTQARTYVLRDPDILLVDYDEQAQEPVEREFILERWGSRRLFHWFAQVVPDTTVGLHGTAVGCDERHVWIEQKLRRITFAVAARFVGAPARLDSPNSHAARITTERARDLHGQLYLAVVTSEEDEHPLAAAKRRVDEAIGLGTEALLARNEERWAEFWSRSYVRLPDPYLENLYYFSRYQMGASSAGPYPPMHHGGIWIWNHDVGNWGSYYHWNEQQMVWPAHAAGHPELAMGYYDWRFKGLERAKETARKIHGIGGAFYSDVSDRDGRIATNGQMDTHLTYNLTPGSQIAMDFWRHYRYTGDRDFLRTRAYPMMKAAIQFYLEYIERDEKGVYHVPASVGYEGHLRVRDCVPDLAIIRQTLAACVEASALLSVDAAERARWQEVLTHLAAFTLVEENGQTVIATGIAIQDEPGKSYEVGRPYKRGEALFYRGFWLPMAPAFPSGVVGLAQKGTPLFDAVCNAVRIIGPDSPGGWIPSSVFAARLGMAEEALAWLAWSVNHCQMFPQGFMQEGQYHNGSTDVWMADEPRLVRDGMRTEERTKLLSRFHDVPAPECNCDTMTISPEMLFQSHDGILRAFPAMPEAWGDAAFRLHAVGGFVVTAERFHGKTLHVVIESTRGGPCRLANPWGDMHVAIREVAPQGETEPTAADIIAADAVLEFVTKAGYTYVVRRAAQIDRALSSAKMPVPAPGPREGYGRMLGIARHF
ncbi:MAG: hypothetical protein IT330_06615 [Anaerolineae bacterium]|nr:hypothetical protein [Anaerolineae bacterium]